MANPVSSYKSDNARVQLQTLLDKKLNSRYIWWCFYTLLKEDNQTWSAYAKFDQQSMRLSEFRKILIAHIDVILKKLSLSKTVFLYLLQYAYSKSFIIKDNDFWVFNDMSELLAEVSGNQQCLDFLPASNDVPEKIFDTCCNQFSNFTRFKTIHEIISVAFQDLTLQGQITKGNAMNIECHYCQILPPIFNVKLTLFSVKN